MTSTQQGVGLIEALISLFLTCIIITALTHHYINAKQQYNHLQARINDEMELQLAVDLMRDSIRQAGFTPCLKIDHLITSDRREGHERLSSINISSGLQSMIEINRMSAYFDIALARTSSTQLVTTRRQNMNKTHPILIADCTHAEVHTIRDITYAKGQQIITLNESILFNYEPTMYVGEWLQERFFVHDSKGLFYHRHRTDELTSRVKTLSATLEKIGPRAGVKVIIGLDGRHNIEIYTRVRA